MNAKVLTLILGLLMLVPAGYAAGIKFGDCPSGYECAETPDDGGPFPPDAVTGHTVYANFVREAVNKATLGLPTDFAAVAGYFADIDNRTIAVQRECVVWFNGNNLDQRPAVDNFPDGENAFPSDEDQDQAPGGAPNHDESYQDYDFDRDIENCLPAFDVQYENNTTTLPTYYPAFAVVVEAGDCDPMEGVNHRFRGHLDFVDPNNVYHEVQEYDYQCSWFGPGGGLGKTALDQATSDVGPTTGAVNPLGFGVDPASRGQWQQGGLIYDAPYAEFGADPSSDLVKDMFPWTYTDPHAENGCAMYDNPVEGDGFDFGHKCNGSLQDMFTERMWMTAVHNTTYDPTIDNIYNFALQIDTCAGWNIYEGETPFNSPGKDEVGVDRGGPETGTRYADGAQHDPQRQGDILGVTGSNHLDEYHDVAYHTYYGEGLDDFLGGWPLFDVCTDGSSFSFDDTPRGRTVHSGAPAGIGDTDIMRGNSYDFDNSSSTFGKHRTNCRHNLIDWPYNTYPPGVGDDCYPEDHKTAQIDIYVYYDDPTGGLWALNSNGMTGVGVPYVGPGCPTGPNELPPYAC